MNVIFLDIDGVLNDYNYRETVADYYESPIDESKLHLLKALVDKTNAKIVLSSTWRMYWGDDSEDSKKLDEVFKRHGLEIYSKTEYFHEERDIEILMYLARNKAESYVILDDIDFNWCEKNRMHFVQTFDETGITEETVEKAVRILSK